MHQTNGVLWADVFLGHHPMSASQPWLQPQPNHFSPPMLLSGAHRFPKKSMVDGPASLLSTVANAPVLEFPAPLDWLSLVVLALLQPLKMVVKIA